MDQRAVGLEKNFIIIRDTYFPLSKNSFHKKLNIIPASFNFSLDEKIIIIIIIRAYKTCVSISVK